MAYKAEDFSLDLRKSVVPDNHVWVNSGYSTCAPYPHAVMGVKGCFAPPFAAGDTALLIELEGNGHRIQDTGNRGKDDCGLLYAGAQWRPDKIVRTGTYHFRVSEQLISLKVTSELIPLTGKAGFMVKISVLNRSPHDTLVRAHPVMDAGHPCLQPLALWDYMPPRSQGASMTETGSGIWENSDVRVTLFGSHGEGCSLKANGVWEFSVAVVLTPAGQGVKEPCIPELWQYETEQVWKRRIHAVSQTIPELRSDIPGLENYYKRSLISGLVCLWENDDYCVSPFPATSGVDGGSLCCYPWDVAGYSAETLVMLLGDKAFDFIKLMLKSGIDKHISMSLSGEGLGWCSYAYSMWSIINLYWVVITHLGEGFELFDDIVALFMEEEARLPEWAHLKDYGQQHNLLEMRSCGYEYYVPSPNAERAWCYDRLADIAEHTGRKDTAAWRVKAEEIRLSIRRNLWDAGKGWFACIHPEGQREMVYSIQMFDALRMGACTEEMKQALVSHIRDGAFLGPYGVSSVSAEDELHYEINDPDWSGGGCYTGDAPNLAETLWQQREPELAWKVLGRLFWMGDMLPYFPQEHDCDRPSVPAHKRANIIAGVAGLQSLLYGMAGIQPQMDGALLIHPQPSPEGTIEILGYRYRKATLDLVLNPDHVCIRVDGRVVYEGSPCEIVLFDPVKVHR